jgi:hypothetical protein
MLLENYDKEGLLFITSVLGKTTDNKYKAFRGDLVLIQGVLHDGVHMPPQLLLHQAAALADENKFLFVNGMFSELAHVTTFIEHYKSALTPDTILLMFVENIAEKMLIQIDGLTFKFVPYRDGMVWNETLEILYIEKSDLKGQSAEDKVVTVYEAAKDFTTKTGSIAFEEALTKTIFVKKELHSGPV